MGDLAHWRPALPGPVGSEGFFGELPAGVVYSAMAPGGDFALNVASRSEQARPAFSWATQFEVPSGGSAALRFTGWPLSGIGGGIEIVIWLVVGWTLLDRRFAIRARLRALAAARPSETTVRPSPRDARGARPGAARPRGGGATR